jgi:hypothetical protein
LVSAHTHRQLALGTHRPPGGLNTCSRALAALLVPLDGEPLVSVCRHILLGAHHNTEHPKKQLRIVDKYSVHPATTSVPSISLFPGPSLTLRHSYIGSEFPKLLEKPIVEYRQANLTVQGMLPDGSESDPLVIVVPCLPTTDDVFFQRLSQQHTNPTKDRTSLTMYSTLLARLGMTGPMR